MKGVHLLENKHAWIIRSLFPLQFNPSRNWLKLEDFPSFKFKFSEEYLIVPLFSHTSLWHGWLTQVWVFTHPGLINHVLSRTLGLLVSLRGDYGQASNASMSCTTLQVWMHKLQGDFCNSFHSKSTQLFQMYPQVSTDCTIHSECHS